MSQQPAFSGSVPKTYHNFLGPLIFSDYARDIAGRLKPRDSEHILELAAGTCIVTKEIARAMPASARLTVTDISEPMLNVGKGLMGDDHRLTYQPADACNLPFPDRSFDAIACQYGVMFFPDKVKAMQEARRVLKPGGRYIFSVWDSLEHNPIPRIVQETVAGMFTENPPIFLAKMPYGWFDHAEIQRVVLAGGFTRCEIETVGFPSVAPKAEDAARGFIEGTPLLAGLMERGVTDPTPYREAASRKLAERYGDRPCSATMRAIVVSAS